MVAGGIVNIVFLPIDVYQLVNTSLEIHRKTPSEIVEQLKGLLEVLENGLKGVESADF